MWDTSQPYWTWCPRMGSTPYDGFCKVHRFYPFFQTYAGLGLPWRFQPLHICTISGLVRIIIDKQWSAFRPILDGVRFPFGHEKWLFGAGRRIRWSSRMTYSTRNVRTKHDTRRSSNRQDLGFNIPSEAALLPKWDDLDQGQLSGAHTTAVFPSTFSEVYDRQVPDENPRWDFPFSAMEYQYLPPSVISCFLHRSRVDRYVVSNIKDWSITEIPRNWRSSGCIQGFL